VKPSPAAKAIEPITDSAESPRSTCTTHVLYTQRAREDGGAETGCTKERRHPKAQHGPANRRDDARRKKGGQNRQHGVHKRVYPDALAVRTRTDRIQEASGRYRTATIMPRHRKQQGQAENSEKKKQKKQDGPDGHPAAQPGTADREPVIHGAASPTTGNRKTTRTPQGLTNRHTPPASAVGRREPSQPRGSVASEPGTNEPSKQQPEE